MDDPELPDCRILLGMYGGNRNAIWDLYGQTNLNRIDQRRAMDLKKELARGLREQLTIGVPTNKDEKDLRKLANQLKDGTVRVKLFTRTSLHAKLYLIYDDNQKVAKKVGFLGNSNLTFSGLNSQGELNIDVLQDAAQKLSSWFRDRWNGRFCIDFTEELD